MNGKIVVKNSARDLHLAVAQMISDVAARAIRDRGYFSVALSGGSTPKALFELLATDPWRKRIDWASSHIFWGDERYVSHTDPRSNYGMTKQALLDHINISAVNVHPVDTSLPPAEAASRYEQTVRNVLGSPRLLRVDFNLLGLGENGHTASLFPHRPTLHEQSKLVASDFIPEVNMHRITMTLPLINASRYIAFLVSGLSKAEIVRDVITGPPRPEDLPAQLIEAKQGELLWMLDTPAASQLPPELIQRS